MKRFLGVLGVAVAVVACGPSTTTGNQTSPSPAVGGEANNGEGAAVPYVDSRFHYRIDAPGRMTANQDGTASVIGPSERLEVAIVQGSRAADLAAMARADIASTGVHVQSGPTKVTINGRQVQKYVYKFNAGTSSVTGKPLDMVGVRYYIPKDSATVAVVTYGIVASQYDPQGADDIASTFQWQ